MNYKTLTTNQNPSEFRAGAFKMSDDIAERLIAEVGVDANIVITVLVTVIVMVLGVNTALPSTTPEMEKEPG